MDEVTELITKKVWRDLKKQRRSLGAFADASDEDLEVVVAAAVEAAVKLALGPAINLA